MNQAVTPPSPVRPELPTHRVREASWSARLIALVIFAPALAVLLTASSLTANDEGIGTHTQLGLAPCGFKSSTGLPCATCGMTTSFTHAADGHLLTAFVTQPAGAVLAVLTAMVVLVSGWSLASGMSLVPIGIALWRPRVIITMIALILGGWLYTLIKTAVLQ
ncbi:hypothetical protein HNQ40_000499 [Algisphaera agarilytica]|uniref:DUF2752 domain-containing protein n=2 Tax=Algisphaera agarilytica TaxID=1385975 RepID=A0A7X0H3N8_9BACT|nr:hypothetical protein [Algisphaera agarilytica]